MISIYLISIKHNLTHKFDYCIKIKLMKKIKVFYEFSYYLYDHKLSLLPYT